MDKARQVLRPPCLQRLFLNVLFRRVSEALNASTERERASMADIETSVVERRCWQLAVREPGTCHMTML